MPEGRYIAYYRVSTARQGASGLGQEAQRQAVETFTNGRGWELVGEYHEVESGKRHENRPELEAALAVYPTARLEDTVGGIILKPSPPPVPKPRVVVSKLGER